MLFLDEIFQTVGQDELSNGDRALKEGGAVNDSEVLAPAGLQHQRGVPAEDGIPGEHDGQAIEGGRGVPKILQLLAGEEDKASALGVEGKRNRVQLERRSEQE